MRVRVVPLKLTAPVKSRAPLFVPLPSVRSPVRLRLFAIVRAVAPSLEIVPAAAEIVPTPKAASFPACKVPVVRVVPPAYVFAPVSVTVPALFMVSVPEASVEPIVPLVSVSDEALRLTPPMIEPDPLTVMALARLLPLKSKTPVPLTEIAAVPKAELSPAFSVPAVTEVAPPKPVLARETVRTPPPLIVSAPAPVMSASIEALPEALMELAVRTPVEPVMLPPESVTAPTDELKDVRSSVPVPLTVIARCKAVVEPAARVPAETVVPAE